MIINNDNSNYNGDNDNDNDNSSNNSNTGSNDNNNNNNNIDRYYEHNSVHPLLPKKAILIKNNKNFINIIESENNLEKKMKIKSNRGKKIAKNLKYQSNIDHHKCVRKKIEEKEKLKKKIHEKNIPHIVYKEHSERCIIEDSTLFSTEGHIVIIEPKFRNFNRKKNALKQKRKNKYSQCIPI